MALNRSPDIMYNGSGYVDKTARDAICKADKDLLKLRRLKVINRLHSIAEENSFHICGEINLVYIEGDEDV